MKLTKLFVLAAAGIVNMHAAGITGLCNTGVTGPCSGTTGAGSGLAPSGNELHWLGSGFTSLVPSSIPAPPWVGDGPVSRWISISPDSSGQSFSASYVYSLTFNVDPSVDLATVSIVGRYLSDNGTIGVQLNALPVAGFPFNALNSSPSFTTWTNFTIPATANFQHGSNTLDWTVRDFGGYTGLRVEFFEINASQVPEPASYLLGGLGLAAAGLFRRKRNAPDRS